MPPVSRSPVLPRRRPHRLPRLSPSLARRPAAVVRALWATGAPVRQLSPVRRLAGGPAPRSLRGVARGRRPRGGARPEGRPARARVAEALVTAMSGMMLRGWEEALLVPVPLGPRRLRQRGYNQSDLLARALGRRWNRPVAELLVRVRDTPTQTALTPAARRANVAGAFELRISDCGLRIEGAPVESAIRNPQSAIVLVDDVFTTGATLAEAARALERAGARAVLAVTFGRAVLPDFS